MQIVEKLQEVLLVGGMICLAIMVCFCLFRAVLGPKFTDRIVAVNMIGTKTILMICLLAVYKQEEYLLDVSLVYALISFVAVVVLAKVYLTMYQQEKEEKNQDSTQQAKEEEVSC